MQSKWLKYKQHIMKIVPETLWFLAYFRTVKSQATNYDALILALRATPKFNEKEKLLSM